MIIALPHRHIQSVARPDWLVNPFARATTSASVLGVSNWSAFDHRLDFGCGERALLAGPAPNVFGGADGISVVLRNFGDEDGYDVFVGARTAHAPDIAERLAQFAK